MSPNKVFKATFCSVHLDQGHHGGQLQSIFQLLDVSSLQGFVVLSPDEHFWLQQSHFPKHTLSSDDQQAYQSWCQQPIHHVQLFNHYCRGCIDLIQSQVSADVTY